MGRQRNIVFFEIPVLCHILMVLTPIQTLEGFSLHPNFNHSPPFFGKKRRVAQFSTTFSPSTTPVTHTNTVVPTAARTKRRITATVASTTALHAAPKRNTIVMTIPVLGPIPNSPPILVGEDRILKCPSPLQWNTIEECIHNHQLYVKESQEEHDVVGIDAAPIVAFMDDVTSKVPIDRRHQSKYATIAAIVGISSSSASEHEADVSAFIDTSSTTSFMESLQSITSESNVSKSVKPLQSKIRLLGIGRASLKGFHSRLPNSYWQTRDRDEEIIGGSPKNVNFQRIRSDTDDDHNHDDDATPLLMAQFSLLTDTDQRSEKVRQQQLGTNYKQHRLTRYVSPVHAIAEMSQWSFKLDHIHSDRQRLVRGLKAAQIRLQQKQRKLQNEEGIVALEDHDGIGQLASGFVIEDGEDMLPSTPTLSSSSIQADIQMLLQEFASEPNDSSEHHISFPSALHQVLQMENYGLGNTAAAFSAIPPLTKMLIDKLQAYYSPAKSATEEHYYEIQSFMAILSLRSYSTDHGFFNTALQCTNTMERMSYAYETMVQHQLLLKQASEEISSMLLECGEECTDLW